jgi:hypothetical protein
VYARREVIMIEEQSILKKIKYPYPRQRVFGLFLICAGITMFLSTILGTSNNPNFIPFIIGYTAGMIGIMYNKKVRNRFAIGESTPIQEKASKLSVLFLAVIVPIIGISLRSTGNLRVIWLLILLAVGIHFIPFTIVHGRLSLLLAILVIINSCLGMYFVNTTFVVFGIADAIIKIIIGIMLFQLTPKFYKNYNMDSTQY